MKYFQWRRSILAALISVLFLAAATPARADTAGCQSTIAKQLRKYKKVYIKSFTKCFDKENTGKITGPCPDFNANEKIQKTIDKVTAGIAASCTSSDLATLGFRTDCVYESNTVGAEADCAALNVLNGSDIDPTLFAQCLECWKSAELREYVGILFASHVGEACGTATSTLCSDIDCASPLPDQRNLTGGERDCQLGIAKGGFKYIFKREKTLEKCALDGGTRVSCLADGDVQAKLMKAEQSKMAKIKSKCGNRDPALTTPFCCRTGTGNSCSPATSRDDCVMNVMGTVQEDKTCSAGTCASVMGNKQITWWTSCPESETCTDALSTLDDVIGCVDTTADAVSDELMCLQFRGNAGADWPCPPSE
jgi:hypothetical protein